MPRPDTQPDSTSLSDWTDDEIRSAVRWLLNDPTSPWRQAKGELARLLGFQGRTPTASLKGLTRRAWIYPNMRGHLSRTLARVMAGELVPVIPDRCNAKRSTKVADNPLPIGAMPPLRLRASIGRDGPTIVVMPPRSREPNSAPFPSPRQVFAGMDKLRGVPSDAVRPSLFSTLKGVTGGVPRRR
jgi:hypothetical protein